MFLWRRCWTLHDSSTMRPRSSKVFELLRPLANVEAYQEMDYELSFCCQIGLLFN